MMPIVTFTFDLWSPKSIELILSTWLTCLLSLMNKYTSVYSLSCSQAYFFMSIVTLNFDLLPPKWIGFILSPWLTKHYQMMPIIIFSIFIIIKTQVLKRQEARSLWLYWRTFFQVQASHSLLQSLVIFCRYKRNAWVVYKTNHFTAFISNHNPTYTSCFT